MPPEFNGIEKRLDELNERLARLEPIADCIRKWIRKKVTKEEALKSVL